MKPFWMVLWGCLGCTTAACASHPSPVSLRTTGMTMPNPTGCYVKVFDREQFQGVAEFINGPHRYATLDTLPNEAKWNNRVRSVQVGPGAAVTVWADEKYEGASIHLIANRKYGALIDSLAGKIKSMDVSCTSAPNG